MDEQLEEKFGKAIDLLISQFKPGATPKCDECMKFSEAILNLAQAKQILEGKSKKTST